MENMLTKTSKQGQFFRDERTPNICLPLLIAGSLPAPSTFRGFSAAIRAPGGSVITASPFFFNMLHAVCTILWGEKN